MITIIGGTYLEICIDPPYEELYGSGLRAAAALSKKGININFHTFISSKYKNLSEIKASTFGYTFIPQDIPHNVAFEYYHPLSPPFTFNNNEEQIFHMNGIEANNVLYYGMIEGDACVKAEYMVYDPQNHKSLKESGSTAKHLALILNKREAILLSQSNSDNLADLGRSLLLSEGAEVVVIKNGAQGALVIESNNVSEIPVFKSDSVWPIGTGDIFSAVFAWKWMTEKLSAYEAALSASEYTAIYCQSRHLPLPKKELGLDPLNIQKKQNSIYLAGPFFTISERWLVNELRSVLHEFGNLVFSPYHEIGLIQGDILSESEEIATKDLENLLNCDTVLAVVDGLDAGTLFEIGYAVSNKKKVVVLAENVSNEDLVMLFGTNCIITDDFSTAVYKASW